MATQERSANEGRSAVPSGPKFATVVKPRIATMVTGITVVKTAIWLATSPNLTPDQIAEHSKIPPYKRALYYNKSFAPENAKLAPEVRKAVSENIKFKGDIDDIPGFGDLAKEILKNPKFEDAGDLVYAALWLANSKDLCGDKELQDMYAKDERPEVRMALAYREDLLKDAETLLLNDNVLEVRAPIIRRKSLNGGFDISTLRKV